ncbi:MAG: CHAT domain-containing protein [Gammaproteobacteria bacterium]|nr:CHAT domain-containing protein [Gammaproteobacteria bacterium]
MTIFISHSTLDDGFVRQLREALEGRGITVWTDSRELTAGDSLEARIQAAIRDAGYMIAVLSLNAINSHQVPWEIRYALAHNKKVIPLLLPGIQSSALRLWFDKEPLAIAISPKPGGLDQALPALLAALGRQLPNDPQPVTEVAAQPLAELVLCLRRPGIETSEGKRRQYAEAELIFYPPAQQSGTREVRSEPFDFIAPIGVIERSDLHWYLESYYAWPVGVFKERARQVEAQLPQWGRALFDAALGQSEAVQVLRAWENTGDWQKRFSVEADAELSKRASEEQRKTARQAATELLTLPWELLHDGRGYLFQGRHKVRVRRRLPNRVAMDIAQSHVPVRILLVSPRPEEEGTGYIDHRISALPLVEAVERLGSLAHVTVLAPPTFPALEQALDQARQKDRPFDVVHFDGHGVYDPEHGLGGLCFENPNDANKLAQRRMTFIDAAKLAAVVRDQRIPLVFLEACQSAKSEEDPTASVAAKLLEQGVTSIVAMSHSVLVESARRFVEAFYQALARGERTGQAMLAGQNALYTDTFRLKVMGAGDLHLQDWFVPVLYQEREDPQLFQHIAPKLDFGQN